MRHTLSFDLNKVEDEAGYYRALNAETYVLTLFNIKKAASVLPDKASKADLLNILASIHSAIEEIGV